MPLSIDVASSPVLISTGVAPRASMSQASISPPDLTL